MGRPKKWPRSSGARRRGCRQLRRRLRLRRRAHMVQQAVGTFGGLDVLVNNAGILRDRMIFNMDEDDRDAVVKVHLRGHYAPVGDACAYWRDRAKEMDGPVHASVICTARSSVSRASRADELRRREGRDRDVRDRTRARDGALRREGELRGAVGHDPVDHHDAGCRRGATARARPVHRVPSADPGKTSRRS